MRAILISAAILICCGCASTHWEYTSAAGDKFSGHSNRMLWQTENVHCAMQTNGLPSVDVTNTRADGEAITASATALGTLAGTAAKVAAGVK